MVGIGGALGAMLRHGVNIGATRALGIGFPYGYNHCKYCRIIFDGRFNGMVGAPHRWKQFLMASVKMIEVDSDEDGMRLDRWFKAHYPGLGFGALQKLLRSGQVRVDGGRVKSDTRLKTGQNVRIPPMQADKAGGDGAMTAHSIRNTGDADALRKMTLYEDNKVLVINKPPGLSVQGGSNVPRHVDGMLEALRNKKGEKPRLVHRLDRDTSGVLVIAKSRGAAQKLSEAFRTRDTQKTYWALLKGMPPKIEGTIKSFLLKEQTPDGDRYACCITWYKRRCRTHQLRVHSLQMGCPIIGDPKYFDPDPNWDFPGGIQNKLHLHARKLRIPNPAGGWINVEAPMPQHMLQSWNLLGLNEADGEMTAD
ncbi:Ribosomal large subunit pseudouridine synthase C [Nymphon striatum]|nr:Ribosomal large subunit pseudouridine synthase C [Nymphon striatum]